MDVCELKLLFISLCGDAEGCCFHEHLFALLAQKDIFVQCQSESLRSNQRSNC